MKFNLKRTTGENSSHTVEIAQLNAIVSSSYTIKTKRYGFGRYSYQLSEATIDLKNQDIANASFVVAVNNCTPELFKEIMSKAFKHYNDELEESKGNSKREIEDTVNWYFIDKDKVKDENKNEN